MSISGSVSTGKKYRTQSPRTAPDLESFRQVEQELEEVEEASGLELNHFDSIEIDPSLPADVSAATKYRKVPSLLTDTTLYSDTTLALSPRFSNLPKPERLDVLGHEGIHSAQFNGYLEPQLEEKFDPETARFFSDNLHSNRRRMEGTTQLLNSWINPGTSHSHLNPYPKEKEMIEQEAWKNGIEPESELVQQIDNEINKIYDQFNGIQREVYGVESKEDFYHEKGSIGDLNYDIVISGEDAEEYGEKMAEKYLTEMVGGLYSENYNEEEIYGGETVIASPRNQPGSFNDYSETGV